MCLVLLRNLSRGGSKFRRWFAAAACKYAFDCETRERRIEFVHRLAWNRIKEAQSVTCLCTFVKGQQVVQPWSSSWYCQDEYRLSSGVLPTPPKSHVVLCSCSPARQDLALFTLNHAVVHIHHALEMSTDTFTISNYVRRICSVNLFFRVFLQIIPHICSRSLGVDVILLCGCQRVVPLVICV